MGFLVIDCAGLTLTLKERERIASPMVLGVILFSRNFLSQEQVSELIESIRQVDPQMIIMIDQEGGRVLRMNDAEFHMESASSWGKLYQADRLNTAELFYQKHYALNHNLMRLGIDMNLGPVLDLNYQHNAVIGTRSFSSDVNVIIQLAEVQINAMQAAGMPVTGKHFPGHGYVSLDSHYDLPIDDRSWVELTKQDAQPFVQLIDRLDCIMPAHILYPAVSAEIVTFSQYWLQDILRDQFGFSGVVISDDLSMQAARHPHDLTDSCEKALLAGCDVLLACNVGDEIEAVLSHSERFSLWENNSAVAVLQEKYFSHRTAQLGVDVS